MNDLALSTGRVPFFANHDDTNSMASFIILSHRSESRSAIKTHSRNVRPAGAKGAPRPASISSLTRRRQFGDQITRTMFHDSKELAARTQAWNPHQSPFGHGFPSKKACRDAVEKFYRPVRCHEVYLRGMPLRTIEHVFAQR